jgi:hypothetical protein
MSSLQNLPNPNTEKKRMQRKRSAPRSSVDQLVTPCSSQPQRLNSSLPPTGMAPSMTASIPMQMPSKPQAAESHSDLIDRVLLNVESRMVQHSSVFEQATSATIANNSRANSNISNANALHGKLTADELDHLSLLSTSSVGLSYSQGVNGNSVVAANTNDFNWSNVDIDSITHLSGYLEEHAKSAISIDLIQGARVAFERNDTMVRI